MHAPSVTLRLAAGALGALALVAGATGGASMLGDDTPHRSGDDAPVIAPAAHDQGDDTAPTSTSTTSVTSPTTPTTGRADDSGPKTSGATSASTQTFVSPGGSVTVRLEGGVLTLVSTQPAAGFGVEVHDARADRVEVRFEGGVEWRIRVDVEQGVMVAEITQHD